jgi:putative peptidoglycan lipid II flippase
MAAYQLNDLVSMAVAGNAGSGIQSSLQYSLRLQELILGIFAVTIGTIILPDLTSHAKNKDFDQFNGLLKIAIRIIAFITIPITFFAFVTGENIIRLVFQSNSFSEESVFLVNKAFQYHIVGLFFIALNRILSPAFYAQSNTKSPTIAGIIGFGANIVLAIVLAPAFKGGGIAFALSASSGINTVFLFIFMKKGENKGTGELVKTTILYSLKMIILSIVAIIPVILLKNWIFVLFANYNRLIAQGLPLIILAIIFGIIGLLLMVITKDPLLKTLVSKIKRQK